MSLSNETCRQSNGKTTKSSDSRTSDWNVGFQRGLTMPVKKRKPALYTQHTEHQQIQTLKTLGIVTKTKLTEALSSQAYVQLSTVTISKAFGDGVRDSIRNEADSSYLLVDVRPIYDILIQ